MSFSQNSSALACWEQWIQSRKKVHQKLGENLNRKPGELLMNASDELKNVKEEKILFNNAKITRNFDKYRGNPSFWTLPPGDNAKDPTYFLIPTKEQKNELTEIEHVGVPEVIAQEKDILPRKRNVFTTWKSLSYRIEQRLNFSNKINEIEPHKPDYSDLVIVGHQIKEKNEKISIEEPLSCSQTHEKTENKNEQSNKNDKKLSLIINDINTCKINAGQSRFYKMYLFFEHDIESEEPSKAHLKFDNKGTVTLRIYFKKYEKLKLFRHFIVDTKMKPFFFNKNELIILPGETIFLPIWFKSKEFKCYQEFWEISTMPKIWEEDFHLIVMFNASTTLKFYNNRVNKINIYLKKGAARIICENILENILKNINYAEPDMVVCEKFGEKQMFESENFDLTSFELKPKYFYNEIVVNELKEFYKTVKLLQHPQTWNYSITELKKIARERDIYEYVEMKTVQRIKLREKRLEVTEKKVEKRNSKTKIKEKLNKVSNKKSIEKSTSKSKEKQKMERFKEIPFEETILELKPTYYNKLQTLLAKLERQFVNVNNERMKFSNSFHIVRAVFTKMDFALEDLRIKFKIPVNNYPNNQINVIPDRLIYEFVDDLAIIRMKRVPPEQKIDFYCLPKSDILYGIPLNDSENIYKIYFNKNNEYDNKKSLKSKENAKLEASESKMSRKSLKNKDDSLKSPKIEKKKEFNPFSEEFSFNFDNLEENISKSSEIINIRISLENLSKDEFKEYQREMYLIIYFHLEELVNNLVDSLNSCNEKQISNELFSDLMKHKVDKNVCSFNAIPLIAQHDDKTLSPTKSLQNLITEDKLYFDNLLELNWLRNNQTKNYIVNNLTKKEVEKDEIIIEENTESAEIFDPANYVRKILEYVPTYHDNYSQTCTCIDLKQFFENLPSNHSLGKVSEERPEESFKQPDVFYHVSDDDN